MVRARPRRASRRTAELQFLGDDPVRPQAELAELHSQKAAMKGNVSAQHDDVVAAADVFGDPAAVRAPARRSARASVDREARPRGALADLLVVHASSAPRTM